MTFEEFLNEINVNSPQYRGAPMPPEDKKQINVTKFPDAMRPKSYTAGVEDEEGELSGYFDYVTQGEFDAADFQLFKEEFCRCVNYLAELHNFKEPFVLDLDVVSRDGPSYGYQTALLPFNDFKAGDYRSACYKCLRNTTSEEVEDLRKAIKYAEHGLMSWEDCYKIYCADSHLHEAALEEALHKGCRKEDIVNYYRGILCMDDDEPITPDNLDEWGFNRTCLRYSCSPSDLKEYLLNK